MKYTKYLALWIACVALVSQGWIAVVAGAGVSLITVSLHSSKNKAGKVETDERV